MIIFKLGCHNRFARYCRVNMLMPEHIWEAESSHDGVDVMIAFSQWSTVHHLHSRVPQTTITDNNAQSRSQKNMVLMLLNKFKHTPLSMCMPSETHTLLNQAKK